MNKVTEIPDETIDEIIDENIGKRIKELRHVLGLKTQKDFADKTEIERNNIAGYETGRRTPSKAAISLICNKLNVNRNWLLRGEGEMFITIDKEDELMMWAASILKDESDSFKRRFVNMLMNLDESDWKALEKMSLLLHKKND